MSFMDEIRKIPPVTRFLCASSLAVSVPVMVNVLSPYRIVFVKELVIQQLELWRPFTSFFFAGSGINFLFDFIMLYRNSDALESTQYSGRSADYAWQLLLSASAILGLNLPLRSFIHFRPLLLCLIYISSRLSPNAQVSIFGLLTLPNSYFPYAMLAMDLVMGGAKSAAGSLTGLIAGHAWWYLVHSEESGRPGQAFATAPGWLRALVGDGAPRAGPAGSTGGGRVFGSANTPRAAPRPQATGYNWGTGQRLGQE